MKQFLIQGNDYRVSPVERVLIVVEALTLAGAIEASAEHLMQMHKQKIVMRLLGDMSTGETSFIVYEENAPNSPVYLNVVDLASLPHYTKEYKEGE